MNEIKSTLERDYDTNSMSHVWPRERPDSVTRIHPIRRAESITSTSTTSSTSVASSLTTSSDDSGRRHHHHQQQQQQQQYKHQQQQHQPQHQRLASSQKQHRQHTTEESSSDSDQHEQKQHQIHTSHKVRDYNAPYRTPTPVEPGSLPYPRNDDIDHTRIVESKPHVTRKTTTRTKTQLAIPDEAELNCAHYSRWPGWLKLAQLLVAIVCFVILVPLTWFAIITSVVVSIFFACTLLICIFYLFTLSRVVFPTWPWLTIEYWATSLASLAYIVCAILMLIFTNQKEYEISLREFDHYYVYLIVALLALINGILYAVGAKWIAGRRRRHHTLPVGGQSTVGNRNKPATVTLRSPYASDKVTSGAARTQVKRAPGSNNV